MPGRGGNKDDSWQPGPGKYMPDMDAVKPCSVRSAFGTGKRSDMAGAKKGAPGPGSYNPGVTGTGDSLKYSIGNSKRPKDNYGGVPGPGAYRVPYYVAEVPTY